MRHKIFAFILVAALMLGIGLNVYADDDRSYYIADFLVSARISENGDMQVEEKITYDFDGAFNGVFRTLELTGSEGIAEVQVSGLNSETAYLNNESGQNNTFQVQSDGSKRSIIIFSKSKNESKTFIIKYLLKRPATKYNDTSELYWKFMGTDTDVKINNFRVVVHMPEGVQKPDIKAFAHGPLSGNIEIFDDGSVGLNVKRLLPQNMVEARILFPAAALSDQAKLVNEDALGRILAEEEQWIEEANRKRMVARAFVGIAFVLALFQLLMILYIYLKYDKEYKSMFKGIYLRELPYNYAPAVMAVLWNFGKVTPKEITATLMDLVRKRVLTLEVAVAEKHGLFGSKQEEDYVFKKAATYNDSTLSEQERFLVEWLIDEIGDGSQIGLVDLKDYTKSTAKARDFKTNYDAWVEIIKMEAEKQEFFDQNSRMGILIGVLVGIAGMIFGGYTLAVHENIIGFILLFFTSLILIIYSALVKRRSYTGVEHFSKWKAFRKYLTDFSMLKEAEMPAITLWEHYLVYAISLGVAKEVIKQLKVMFRDEDFKNSGLTYMYYGYYGHGMRHLDSLDHITTNIIKTTESTYTQAMSQLSSKGGSGGGFSGGGGGGGGGGGAGAF